MAFYGDKFFCCLFVNGLAFWSVIGSDIIFLLLFVQIVIQSIILLAISVRSLYDINDRLESIWLIVRAFSCSKPGYGIFRIGSDNRILAIIL